MKKWFLNPNALLKSLGAFALCFVMLFTMGAVCLPDSAYAQSEADMVDDEGGMLMTSELIEHFADITITDKDGNEITSGTGYLDPNQTYTIHFFVDEENARGFKMPDGRFVDLLFDIDQMYYVLPSGLDYELTIPKNGNLTVWATDYQKYQQLPVYAKVELVTESGGIERLVVTWDVYSPGYYLLPISTNAWYELEVQAKVDGSDDMIDLGDGRKFYTDNTARAGFTKTINPEALRNKLTKEQMEDFEFSLKQVCVAKAAADVDTAAGEFVDNYGFVRNANGNIVYEDPQDLTVTLADMTWDNVKKHYYYNFPEKLQPNEEIIQVTEDARPDALAGYSWNEKSSVDEATSTDKLTGGSNLIVSLTNMYTEEQAKLRINKDFGNNSESTSTSGISFKIEGTKANGDAYGPVTYTYADVANKEITLPAGTYKVTEIASKTNYDWTVSYEAGVVGSQSAPIAGSTAETGTVTVGANQTAEFNFTNTYVQHKGSITLSKALNTPAGLTLTDAKKEAMTFTVKQGDTVIKWTKDGDNYVYDPNGSVTAIPYSEFTSGSVKLNGLPVGTYTVVETNPTITGYKRTTTVAVGGGNAAESTTASNVGVSKNGNVSVAYTNTYTENASIKVQKTVNGSLNLSDVNSTLKFKLERKNGSVWETVYNDVSLTNGEINWTGLPFGEYRVTEVATAKPNYTMSTTVSSTTGTVDATNKTATFTLNAGSNSNTTTYTNTYTPKTTDLTINKSLTGTYPDDAASKIEFTVAQSGGATLKWTKVTDNEYEYDPNGSTTQIPYGASIKLTGLPAGYTYTVTEATGASSYTGSYVITTTANGTSSTSANVTLQEGNDGNVKPGTVSFVNNYRPIAKIAIKKTFTGVLSNAYVNAEILPKLRFVVSKVEDGKTLYYTGSEWAESKTGAKKYTYTELSTGLELDANETYYIEELNAEVNGFTVFTWWSEGTGGEPTQVRDGSNPSVTVTPGETPTVNFINDYRGAGEVPGNVQLHTKTWAGLKAEQYPKVRFMLEYKDGNAWKTYETYTLDELTDGQKSYKNPDGTTTVKPIYLPAGQYRLTELDYTVSGYDHEVFIIIVENGNLNHAKTELMENKRLEFTAEDNSTYQFGLANVYTPKGSLKVTKAITGVDNDNRNKNITFKLSRKLGENGTVEDIETFSLADFTNGVYTKSELSTGVYQSNGAGGWDLIPYYYIVTETNATVDHHTLVSTTVKVNDGDASESSSAKVTLQGAAGADEIAFTNNYIRNKGDLTINKTIEGEIPADYMKNITFRVETQSGTVVKWNVVDGENVYNANGVKDSFTFDDMVKVTSTDKDLKSGTFTIKDLETGSYKLVESNADVPGYSRTTEFFVAGIRNEAGNIQVTANGAATVDVTNTYTEIGKLEIAKTVKVDGNGFANVDGLGKLKNTWFTINKADGSYVTGFNLWNDIKVEKVSATEWLFTKTIENLEPGVYIIVEDVQTAPGYKYVETTVSVATRIADVDNKPAFQVEVTSNGGNAIEVGIVNTYKEQGKISVTKTFSGINAGALTDTQKNNIVFGLFEVNSGGDKLVPAKEGDAIASGTYAGWVPYAKMTNGIYTWENLDVSKQYYIKEYVIGEDNANTATGSTFYGYIHEKTAWSGAVTGESTAVPGVVQTANVTPNKNGVNVAFTNTYKEVKKLSVDKAGQNYSSNSVGDGILPVWVFTITVDNVGAASMDANGQMVITDVFDSQNKEWFKLVDVDGFRPAITHGEKVALTAVDNGDGTATYTLTLQEGAPENQQVIFTYYLQPKDFATFQTMLQDTNHKTTPEKPKEDQKDGAEHRATWTYTNTITYYPLPGEAPKTDSSDYFYNTDMVTKTMTAADGNLNVTFTLNINPDALYIGNNNRLIVLDRMSDNVEVNMSSFEVNPSDEAANVKVSRYTGDEDWDIQIEVPNGVALTITYTATITNPDGNVHVTNTVSMEGVVQEVEGDVGFEGGNSGSLSVGAVSIFKSGDTMTVPLQGAKFALYQCENSLLEPYSEPVWQADFTSNEYGIVAVQKWKDGFNKDYALSWDVLYYLVEISAPDGYELDEPNNPIYFRVYEKEEKKKTDTQGNILSDYVKTGTVFERSNASAKDEIVLTAHKTLNGKALAADQFSFQLLDNEGHVLQTKENAADGTVTFDALDYSYEKFTAEEKAAGRQVHTYFIKEVNDGADGYAYDAAEYKVTVTVSLVKDSDNKVTGIDAVAAYTLNDAVVTGAAFTNTYNAEGQYQLTGTKTVQGATIIRDAFDFLIKYGEDKLCTVSTPVDVNGNEVNIPYPAFKFELISSGEESVTYNGTDNIVLIKLKRESLGIGHKYVFTIDEVENADLPYGYSINEFYLTLSAADNGDGTLKVTEHLTRHDGGNYTAANFSNTYLGGLKIQKNVTVGDQPTNSTLADGTYTFGVYQHNNSGLQPNKTVEITVKNGVSNTAVVTGLHGDWTWYIRELSSTNPDVSLVYGVKEVYVPGDKLEEIPTVPFTNNLGIGSLSLTKTVKGLGEYYSDDHKDKEFQFTVTIKDAANKTYTTTGTSAESVRFNVDGRATVTLKAGETISIEGLPIGAAYSIEEEKKLPAGYTAGTITNGTGVIVGGVTEAEQVNTYSAKGEAQLSVTKQVTGNEFTDSETEFTFVLKNQLGNIIETKSGLNENVVVFEKIEYNKPGTYHYTITEVEPETKIPGMTYDNAAHKVVVTVTDNGDGTLKAEAKYGENGADSLTITNTYQKVTFQPKVTKALSGNNVPTENYTFQLLDGETVVDTVTVTGAGDASFGAITKYAAGTYTYTIKEVAGTIPGMTYDSAAHTVTVKVSADNNGALSADIKYDTDKTALTITNTYDKPVGNATISVTKAMSGDPYNGNEQFTFTLTSADTQSATNNKVTGDLSQAIAVGGAASWTVNYDKTGTYTYTIQETKGSTEGVIYDDTAYTVKVVVDYNEAKTALVSAVSYGANEAEKLTVTNKYGETSYQPEVKKVLTGNTSLAPDETFFFTLTGEDMQPLTAQCKADGTAKFGAITYKAPGTYTYAITETAGETEGMTYSDAEITLTVVVEQADDGKLTVTSATYTGGDGEGDTFTNTYREVTYQPEVKKLVTGTGAPEDATFTFQLKEGDKLVGTEKTIKAGDVATFDEIVKHEAGVYTYTITEVKGAVPGMAYDKVAHTVTVTVSEDDNGALSAVIKYDESKDALEVTNVYTTVKYQPKAVKALTGDTDKALEETFSFTLTQTKVPDGVASYTEEKTLAGTGEVAFSEITFALPGTYVFEITENPGTTEGMIYSQEKVVVTVNVTADADNRLSLTADYKGGTGADYNTITNRYGETKHQLTMKKVLTGDTDRYLENETFTFQLLDSEGKVLQTKECKAGESIIFDAITYKTVGTYTYTVEEVKPDTLTPGMTYSDEVIEYTVVVFADDKGKLSAIASPKVGNVTSNVITNVYDRPEGEATIEASKLISGNAYTGDEAFIFTLAQKDEATATNNVITGALSQAVAQNGSASWTVAYDTVGTYTYTIKETKGNTAGMVYDEAEHTVTVKVEYSEDKASLVTTVTYDGEKTDLDITNKFSEISFQPEITKAVVDKGLCVLEEVFTFELVQTGAPEGVNDENTDEAYALVARVDGDENQIVYGTAQFKAFTYNVPGEYTYEIMELAPEEGKGTPGMTYSDEIITLTVTVERNETTGELTLEAVYTGEDGEGDNTITNTYVKPDGMALIMVNKLVTGNTTQADIDACLYDPSETFTFTLAKTTQVIVPSDTNDVVVLGQMEQPITAGRSAVWGLTYDQPGVYTYTVTETKGSTDGMEYDETIYHVTVTVDYNEAKSALVAKVSYDDAKAMTALGEMQVNNKFSAITFQPEIKKTLTGRFLLKEEFNFLLTQVATDDVAVSDPVYTDEISILIDPESTAYEIEASGTGKFDALVYHEPGTYQYQIIEVIPEAKDRTPGMTYSKDVITYTVVVVKDEVTGALSIESETYTTTPAEEGAEAYEGNTFTNAYARPEGEAEIFVNKAMIGNIYNGENEFTFELAKYDPNMSPDEEDKTDDETVAGGGLVAGDTVPSVKSGDSTEENGAGDNTGDGTDNGTAGESGVPTDPAIKPPVKPGIGEMEPLVPMETNNLIFPGELQTIGVDETAKWTIKYDQPGTYEYTLREIKGDEAGVTYDETIYRVTVVMDYLEDENGDRMSLIPATITYADAEGNVIIAEKYTDPDAGEEDAETDPEGGDTTTNPDGADPEQGGTTEGGEGESTEPGEDGGDEGTDPGEGEEPEAVKRGLTITNKYSGVSFVPEISKVVNGRGAPSEYFTFQLTETTEGREYWDTARCLADETAVFDEIVYQEPGVYTYTITELTPEYKTSGMTYSKEVVKLTVRVEDVGDGTGALTIETEYSQDTITNRYNPPSYYNYKFSFTKKWQGGVESTLEWTLYDADGNVVHKKFDKDVIDETEWYYEAWFAMDKGYYIIEDVPEGYEPIYVNVGQYADVTDRLYNGGTIINYKAPQTGDANNPFAWAALMLCSAAAMLVVALRRKRAH